MTCQSMNETMSLPFLIFDASLSECSDSAGTERNRGFNVVDGLSRETLLGTGTE